MTQGTQTRALKGPREGGKGWEVGGRFKSEGTDVHLWLVHVDYRREQTDIVKQ